MLDIGMLEIFVIGALALIVVGPKDLPGLLRTVGQFVGKARGMAREFQRSMEDAAREADLGDVVDTVKGKGKNNLPFDNQIVDSMKEFERSVKSEIKDAQDAAEGRAVTKAEKPAKVTPETPTTAEPDVAEAAASEAESPEFAMPAGKTPGSAKAAAKADADSAVKVAPETPSTAEPDVAKAAAKSAATGKEA